MGQCLTLAGIVGVDPDPRTYRELQQMADGRQRGAWGHTAALMLANQKTMTGQGPRFADLIPERYRDEPASLTDEDAAAAEELAFAELEAGLKAASRRPG